MSERIITLEDLVERDRQESVNAWLLWKAAEALQAGKIQWMWDGSTVQGEPVKAFINNGRWLARCKVCANPMYVSWQTPNFYCPECGNGGSTAAWSVEFPDEREQIEEALLHRPVDLAQPGKLIRNRVELAFNQRPVISGLGRNWRFGVSIEQLLKDNATMNLTGSDLD